MVVLVILVVLVVWWYWSCWLCDHAAWLCGRTGCVVILVVLVVLVVPVVLVVLVVRGCVIMWQYNIVLMDYAKTPHVGIFMLVWLVIPLVSILIVGLAVHFFSTLSPYFFHHRPSLYLLKVLVIFFHAYVYMYTSWLVHMCFVYVSHPSNSPMQWSLTIHRV